MKGEQRIKELQTMKAIAEILNESTDLSGMLNCVLRELLQLTGLSTGWIFLINEKGEYKLAADVNLPSALTRVDKHPMCNGSCWCVNRFNRGQLSRAANIMECKRLEEAIEHGYGDTAGITHHATVPLSAGDETFGLLNVASPHKTLLSEEELALLEAVSLQIGTAIKRIKLVEKEQEHIILSERNRLARDLHDSVNQLLFSLMLTARGTKEMTKEESVKEMLGYIQELSQEALQEMRALIWQLRPHGLEDGIVCALFSYGKVLGLEIETNVQGVLNIPHHVEETLWRIGQEAFNNCKKHAGSKSAKLMIEANKHVVKMQIKDQGCGFHYHEQEKLPSLGLAGMKERAELIGGDVNIHSEVGLGTTITVRVPLK
ncbi:two-component system NarL family sensor kinase [Bacillus mesophilus]|uniref:histidine kinase n=1 Tax=Bacillus mesophilus TaxID=1808955 RepID=A0A6M0QBP8_9BACI|nr:GAF domain-containing sensor histidine kinase [Bacillus mesophilus]MBM7660061.1 two-component system NarL family sensor kinase [Bacillus mesophilus]NEY73716.1 GAF domain-containing sensor histidine kinase [Bacillus mesophilus]